MFFIKIIAILQQDLSKFKIIVNVINKITLFVIQSFKFEFVRVF